MTSRIKRSIGWRRPQAAWLVTWLMLGAGCSSPTIQDFPSGIEEAMEVAVVELDGDGKNDIIVWNSSSLRWLKNDGRGRFGPPTPLGELSGANEILARDMDGDGDVDVVAGGSVFLNGGGGTLTRSHYGSTRASAAILDLDQDGQPDLAAAADDSITLARNQGAGRFEQLTSLSQTDVIVVRSGDFNRDGIDDLIGVSFFHSVFSSSLSATLWLNDGRGNFTSSRPGPLQGRDSLTPIVVLDADGDGRDDIAYADEEDVTVRSGPDFTQELARIDTSPGVTALSLIEPGTEGTGDLVVADRQSNDLSLHEGNKSGKFSEEERAGLDCGPDGLASGDLDGQGELDWVTVDDCTDAVRVVYP